MKSIVRSLLCIFLVVMFLFQINIYADNNDAGITPSIIFEDTSESYPIDAEQFILYTNKYSEFTKPFGTHTHEYIIVNNIVVQENNSGANGTYIPPNGYVISYTGNNEDIRRKFAVGAGLTLSNMDIPVSPDMYFILEDMLIPIDQINTVRDANQIVLYNAAYNTSTKTNPWGLELTVEGGIITKIADMTNTEGLQGQNDSQIPTDGAVISIHAGSPYYKQVREKAKPGISIKISADSKLYNAGKIKYTAYNPRTLADNPAAWDKEKGKPYDSFRGPDQLIVYDRSYGEFTGTNPYGYEITVNSEGIIICTGGNDSKIPAGGYVLSGHGESMQWLQKNALLGSTVITNHEKKEVTIILTPESYTSRALLNIKSAQDRLDLAKLQYLDIPYDDVQEAIDVAADKLSKLSRQLKDGRYENLTDTVQEIQKDADKAWFMTFESVRAENRAVWLRARDTSIEDVRKRFDMLESININTIYLETYWNGYAIYPADNELMRQNPLFNGFDVLDAYIKEAHSRGIELHAWVENFLVGLPIAEKKPEWMNVSRKGDTYYSENGITKYYFLNPALPEVQDFLSSLYKELIEKYDIDGIQFDYLRYPNSHDYTNDFGYDTYTRQLFINFTSTDPISLMPGDSLWQKWCEFREYIISSYAGRIFSELKSIQPEIQISADVWPDYDETLSDIYQNPKTWVRKDYINTLIPMSYYLHEKPVIDDLVNTLAFSRGHSQITSGIATFNKVDTKMFIKQIDAIRASNTSGIAIFEYESLFNSDYDYALRLGAFSTPSSVTDKNPEESIKLILKDIIRKLDDIYLKNNGINKNQRSKYKNLIEKIEAGFNEEQKNNIQEAIKALYNDKNLNGEISKRICADLNRAINIIDGFIANARFVASLKVTAENSGDVLKASEIGYTKVKLEWGSTAIDSDIAGYILYRNGKEILRTSSHSINDDDLNFGETYTYEIHGFDAAGNIVYKSNPLTVKTRASLLADAPFHLSYADLIEKAHIIYKNHMQP